MRVPRTLASLTLAACAMLTASPAATRAYEAEPTCSNSIPGLEVHGQHVVGDYVTGLGHDMSWPPSGQQIGQAVSGNGGAAVPGGPGPGFHFEFNVAPGASFCTGSNSPGVHF